MKHHGWIILDKPLELGSTQAVGAVKRNLREAGLLGKGKDKLKVGHGGTLDPLASGVLPIALGEATKLCGRMLDASKIYDFTIKFGIETETLDNEGDVSEISDTRPSLANIKAALIEFIGDVDQIPPKYSALKIDGQRAYDLARAGVDVAMKMRHVTIYALSIAGEYDDNALDRITLSAHVSKGTYIRSLARDIARAVGSVGHVTMLRRTNAGPFSLKHAISLDKLNEIGKGAPLKDIILPMEAALDDTPALHLSSEQAKAIRQGRVLSGVAGDGLHLAWEEENPIALVEISHGNVRIIRGFNV